MANMDAVKEWALPPRGTDGFQLVIDTGQERKMYELGNKAIHLLGRKETVREFQNFLSQSFVQHSRETPIASLLSQDHELAGSLMYACKVYMLNIQVEYIRTSSWQP